MLEKQYGQRRQRYADRMIPPVGRNGVRVDATEIAHAAAAINGRVGVDDLPPVSRERNAEKVILARHGREIAGDENHLLAVAALADVRECALLGVAAVDPLETVRVEVELVERGLGRVDTIEIGNPAHQPRMLAILEHPPLETFLMLPFAALAELAAHEKELLARVRPHVTIEQPQVRELLPCIARHLADERTLSIYHFIVRKREHE